MSDVETYAGLGGAPATPHVVPSSVWWPAALSAAFVVAAVACAVVALMSDAQDHRLLIAALGYLFGVVLAAATSGVQRASNMKARGRGLMIAGAQRYALSVSKVCVWVGLAAGVVCAFVVATEMSK